KILPALQKVLQGTWIETVKLTIATQGLKEGIKSLTTTMMASPLFWIVAGTFAIGGIIKLVDALTVSVEEQAEKVKTLNEEYQGLQSTLDSTATELEIIQNRIEELEKKDSLTLTERDELENLKQTNDELEKRLALLEKEKQFKAESLAKEAEKLYKKQFGNRGVSE